MTEALDPQALVDALFILVLAAFVGYEIVSKVPTMLHTPLMSGGERGPRRDRGRSDHRDRHRRVAAPAGPRPRVILGTINVVGGFVVTDRMLEMFRGRRDGDNKP